MTDFSFQDFQLLKKSILFFSFGSCQRENLLILRAPYARFLQTCCLATKDLPLDLASFASISVPLKMIPIPTFSLFWAITTWLHVSFPVFLCDFKWLLFILVLCALDFLNFYQTQNLPVSADVWLKDCGGCWGFEYMGWSLIQNHLTPLKERFLGTKPADCSSLLTNFAPNS